MPRHDVVVIGAGQAGLSLGHCLTRAGIEHVLLERHRIGESWRSARWDSFCLVTPNWATRLAGQPYDGPDPDGFMARDALVDRLEAYAVATGSPICTGVEVTEAAQRPTGGFNVQTADDHSFHCRVLVVATGTHRNPRAPYGASPVQACDGAACTHLPASAYRSPQALPEGAVLVVGAAQSGCQIADELCRAGREVILATGQAGRVPRRYRGRDIIEWQRRLGFLDRKASELADPALRFRPDPQLSGQHGGCTLDLRELSIRGVRLTGKLQSLDGDTAIFADDLGDNLTFSDEVAATAVQDIDAIIARENLAAPPPDEHNSDLGYQGPRFVPAASTRLSLRAERVGAVIWATGFRHDFGWVKAPVFDAFGYPIQSAGSTSISGLHFLGLNYVDRRGSGILYGVGEDAEHLARLVATELGATTPG